MEGPFLRNFMAASVQSELSMCLIKRKCVLVHRTHTHLFICFFKSPTSYYFSLLFTQIFSPFLIGSNTPANSS